MKPKVHKSIVKALNSNIPKSIIDYVLQHIKGVSYISFRNIDLNVEEERKFNIIIASFLEGVSLHRIIGFREFYSLNFMVFDGVFEPRPDSEVVVESALQSIASYENANAYQLRILDLGCGTGCLSLSIAHTIKASINENAKINRINVDCVDMNIMACLNTLHNARSLGLTDIVNVYNVNWNDITNDLKYDLILSNPPYITYDEFIAMDEYSKQDPQNALIYDLEGVDVRDVSGYECYEDIFRFAQQHLYNHGHLAFEIGFYTSLKSLQSLGNKYGFKVLQIIKDINNINRCVIFDIM